MKPLEDVLGSISEAIQVVRACKCDSAAALLEMAELELRLKVHDISEAELSAFCHELENRVKGPQRGQVIRLRPKFEKLARRKAT
ncbi:MAG: hypothetical protein PSV22_10625 [Pseudolabrys sp.]|jgi:hypothetical protein|nr:hypothetical protein [Pseudolabrys sp.]